MQICVHLDAARLYRWHLALLAALSENGHEVAVSFGDTPEPLPTSFTVLIDYDHARTRAGTDRFSTLLRPEAFAAWPQYAGGGYDIMIDLSSASAIKTHPGRVVRPLYDGSFKDYALFHAILQQRSPVLSVSDSVTRDHVWALGRPAIETPWRPAYAMDNITSRVVEGLVRVANRIALGEIPQDELPQERTAAGRSSILPAASVFARRCVPRKAARIGELLTGNEAKWHVAWRRITAQAATQSASQELELTAYRTLEDGGRRYFADPFVFAHEGGIYMLPESSAAGGLDLYRAKRFPHEWEKTTRLVEGRIHDATLFAHEGRWWIAAGSETFQSSSWDGLSLFYAESLTGPWHPHPLNPVLVDAAAARPAGALWRDDAGRLIRPAQDCTGGYGSRLTLRAITRLDPETFAEETVGTVSFAARSGILGPHTLSRGGGFEVIDLFARPSALRAGYRE